MPEFFDFQEFPLLETDRLLMRELGEADATALFEYYRDPELTRYIAFDTHTSAEHTKDFIVFMRGLYQQKDSIRWGIQLKETQQLIGTAGLHFWKRDIRCAEVGYHIGQAYWGRGYATEVLRAMVNFGFEHMNLNRIEGCHHPGNEASGRVMEKLGFRKEGVWRQRELKNNSFVDKVWFSLLREEYFSGKVILFPIQSCRGYSQISRKFPRNFPQIPSSYVNYRGFETKDNFLPHNLML